MRYKSVEVQAPAKVNLQLSVGPKEADGYHQVVTVFQAVSLMDVLKISESDQFAISIKGDYTTGVPLDQSNLVFKAVQLMSEKFDTSTKLDVEINKSIPVAGGMAGGSADAAATLLGIDQLYGLGLTKDELGEVARNLGSDVPFMLHGGTAVGRGHGDEITPALSRGTYHWVIAVSSSGLSTPAVYGECDRLRTGLDIKAPSLNDELLQSLLSGDSVRVGKSLNNDLQAAACSLRPALRLILDTGNEYGALGGIVSGSGPSVAFLVADEDHSLDLAVALTSSGVVGSVARAQGPVPGAKVISVN
ncbi:MAG: 4-(cytidine 5'-diphospho)-2-C-methyl-D-erythritol kinase [Candidatus Nanopelagicaceae bacterium]|jgi:4-diphosphocytidyl-2-C-methyl-D-erythritol kinase|nr:4-(cytidine 5'-diphospho)-2-C-methyl-D-erythritol kinase [Candidatus Nanopelagicaceae bacterium]